MFPKTKTKQNKIYTIDDTRMNVDTWSHMHSVSFPTTCHSICKNCTCKEKKKNHRLIKQTTNRHFQNLDIMHKNKMLIILINQSQPIALPTNDPKPKAGCRSSTNSYKYFHWSYIIMETGNADQESNKVRHVRNQKIVSEI